MRSDRYTLIRERDVFNVFENWIRNTKHEDELGAFEWNRNTLLQEIIKQSHDFIQSNSCEGWKSYPIMFLNNDMKKQIIDMLNFMNYKLFYHEIWKRFKGKDIIITEEYMEMIKNISELCDLENILQKGWRSLYDFCYDPRKWCILYSDEDLFTFWDQPFHFRVNKGEWDWNDFSTFFTKKHLNLCFPISKNIAVIIELSDSSDMHGDMIAYITPEWMRMSDYQFHIDIKNWKKPEDSFLWTIKYRIFANCDRYIAWWNKEWLESIVSWYNDLYKHYYHQDMISFIYENTLPKLLEKYSWEKWYSIPKVLWVIILLIIVSSILIYNL